MVKITYDNIRGTAIAEIVLHNNSIGEAVYVKKDIYGFAVEVTPSVSSGRRNLGNDAYFKVYKLKSNGGKSNMVARIYFTRPYYFKHKSDSALWKLSGKDKKNINNYLELPLKSFDEFVDYPYNNITVYSYLLLLANKLIVGGTDKFSNIDTDIVERSKSNPTYVDSTFISIFYPKPDYSHMELIK